MKNEKEKKYLVVSILSLSLLTVMAGAAVAPALGIIKAHFAGSNPLLIQMIISMPALFIILTSFVFPRLCGRMGAKTLVLVGLIFYVLGGCLAGAVDNIIFVLAARALVGIGVGIIMPLSTGLIAFYFAPEEMEKLMGYSSAMNQMGGAIATLLSGVLAAISWRASFLVYLIGLFSLILCLVFLPNDRIRAEKREKATNNMKGNGVFVGAIFLLMLTFFIYPANFAIVTSAEGIVSQGAIAAIMAFMDMVAFFGGLAFLPAKRLMRDKIKFLAPILFLVGYILLAFWGGWAGILIGSFLIGFANGEGIPFIISAASKKAGKSAATTVMPFISASLYLAQFVTPIFMGAVRGIFGNGMIYLPYYTAIGIAICFLMVSRKIKE